MTVYIFLIIIINFGFSAEYDNIPYALKTIGCAMSAGALATVSYSAHVVHTFRFLEHSLCLNAFKACTFASLIFIRLLVSSRC